MRLRQHSIRLLLSAASLLFFVQVIALGVFSIQRLGDVNGVSEEIRSRWLQDTRLLGDLNNYMSDYRAGEGTYLLSRTSLEIAASEKEIAQLDARVTEAQRGYEGLRHDPDEQRLYREFAREWGIYKNSARQVISMAHSGATSEASAKYMAGSRRAFDLSSDTLGSLTDETVTKAREASLRADITYRRDRRLIIAAMVVAACLVAATIIYITRAVSNPLRELSLGMYELAAEDIRVNIPFTERKDEIGEMARSVAVFRENALALERSQRRLVEQAAVLEDTLETERRLTSKQRNFLTMTSHEFRTPLTVIDAQAQRLIKLKDIVTPAEVLRRAERIRSAVQRLTTTMDSLLNASRLLDGDIGYNPAQFNPTELLRDVSQLHRDTTRNSAVQEQIDDLPSLVTGDARLLFTAIGNLLSNAIKYSSPGHAVHISARREGDDHWMVSVRDYGIGIAERDRTHLFERFFRGSNVGRIAGNGVGLHLVAMVLALHGGIVDVVSREGEGSTFSIILPVHVPSPDTKRPVSRFAHACSKADSLQRSPNKPVPTLTHAVGPHQ